jgi:hypothetical protein
VLVLLDPSDSETKKITLAVDLNDKYSVKLWIVNRLHIYVSEDEASWNHYWGSYEGCLTELRVRTHKKWGKYRRHIPLKSVPKHYIHYTSIKSTKIKSGDHKNFEIETDPVVDIHENVKRPYPEGFSWDEFNKGIFLKGIRVLKIPSKKIKYPSDTGILLYWETVIFRDSLASRIKQFRKEKIEGTLTSQKLKESVRPVLRNKLGKLSARLLMHSRTNFTVDIPHPKPDKYFLKEDEHCFLYGISRDVMEKTGQSEGGTTAGRVELRKMSDPLEATESPTKTKPINAIFAKFSLEIFLRGFFGEIKDSLAPVTDKIPPKTGYFWDVKEQTRLIMFFLENSSTTTDYDDEKLGKFLVEKVKSTLKEMMYPDSSISILSNAFQVGIASNRITSTMLALNSIVAQEKTFISTTSIDFLKEGDGDKYLYSIKRVYFATGCDGFSDDMVPRHVYFQLKEWWKNLNKINPNKIEELKESEIIEVIGFSSRFTTETASQDDNRRLRKDRAWKTAMSLKLLLDDEGIDATVTDSPGAKKNGITIYHRGAPVDRFPGEKLFSKYEVEFIEDVIDVNKVEVPDIKRRDTSDDRREDRVCLIVFKKPRPEGNQMIKQTIETNNALPIFQYKTIFHFEKKNNRKSDLVLMYACPGEFDDAYL